MLELQPAGAQGSRVSYGFRFQWAWCYEEMREILYREGLFDIRVVPGMTVPEDLSTRLLLRTKSQLEAIEPEFPAATEIVPLNKKDPDIYLYEIRFRKLGENLITLRHDGGRKTYLEFFATEPLETLIKKRSWFLTHRQQHRDPSKWYNGLFSVYDLKNKILRSPDNTDGFDYWWGYVVACDDPILGKAPFIAAKNVHFPDAEEIAAVEYYLENFVWGKLQRTDQEVPYPYVIYGVLNWKVNRDPLFGWIAYGGKLKISGNSLEVVPRDGLRKRVAWMLPDRRLRLELDRDGLAAEKPVLIDREMRRIQFIVENRTSDRHLTRIKVACSFPTKYAVFQEGKRIGSVEVFPEGEIEFSVEAPFIRVELKRLN